MKTKRKWGRLSGALLCGTMLAGLLSMTAFAEGTGVAINETNFPDDNFREIVKSYDIDGDNALSSSEIEGVTEIDCILKGISSLKGIEHFIALEYLDCSNNQLGSLEMSQNTELKTLDCSWNQLSSLDVSQNTALEELYCSSNQLSSLDVSENTALVWLDCSYNQLSSLDVSQNTDLERLYCYNNQLSSLDVSKNTALKYLSCFSNQLSSLDVSENTSLMELSCSSNQLSSLDVSENTALMELYCASNQLSGLDVSQNTALVRLDCASNRLSSLDVSENTALEELRCFSNQLSSLDVSENTALMELYCAFNQLSSLDVSENTALMELYCASNQLSSLDVSENTALEELRCFSNQLSSLDVSKNTALGWLDCYNNQYTIEVPENRTYDLSTLPGFDVSKARNWQGGTVDGNQLHVNDDVETVTYYYDCGNNKSREFTLVVKILPHPCVFDQKVILEEALKTPADCTHDAVYYMSCACGEISTSEEETFAAEGTALGHDYATAWSSDKTNHWHECSRCQDKKDEAAHNLKTSVTPATMTKAGKAVTKCSICEEVTNTKTIAAIKTVKLSKTSYTYDGKTKTPGLTVKDSAGKTIAGKYYKVEKSSGRKNVGKYTYKITFKGNYKGKKTLSFVINPKGTELISLEAESKGFTARWKKQATQTTGYEIRYATNPKMDKAQTVKITKNSKVSQKITKLSAKKKYYVQIRTYKKINTATYYSGWSKTKTVTTRK